MAYNPGVAFQGPKLVGTTGTLEGDERLVATVAQLHQDIGRKISVVTISDSRETPLAIGSKMWIGAEWMDKQAHARARIAYELSGRTIDPMVAFWLVYASFHICGILLEDVISRWTRALLLLISMAVGALSAYIAGRAGKPELRIPRQARKVEKVYGREVAVLVLQDVRREFGRDCVLPSPTCDTIDEEIRRLSASYPSQEPASLS